MSERVVPGALRSGEPAQAERPGPKCPAKRPTCLACAGGVCTAAPEQTAPSVQCYYFCQGRTGNNKLPFVRTLIFVKLF